MAVAHIIARDIFTTICRRWILYHWKATSLSFLEMFYLWSWVPYFLFKSVLTWPHPLPPQCWSKISKKNGHFFGWPPHISSRETYLQLSLDVEFCTIEKLRVSAFWQCFIYEAEYPTSHLKVSKRDPTPCLPPLWVAAAHIIVRHMFTTISRCWILYHWKATSLSFLAMFHLWSWVPYFLFKSVLTWPPPPASSVLE